jgi:FHA domain-containing protein
VIIITVASYNGTPPQQRLAAQFDELGGNIGRAENNQLVLPDPERTISRVHAQVVFRAGRYAIVDRGSNPIAVNGRPLGNGQEAPLAAGDEIQIGGYRMRVEVGAGGAAGAAAADPFADFGGLAAPSPGGAGRAAPAAAMNDPLAAFGMPAAAPVGDPFARAGGDPFGRPGSGGYGGAPAAPAAAGGIPDDWDPFAPDPKTGAGDFARSLGQPAGGARDLGLEIGGRAAAPLIPDMPGQSQPAADTLDNLFGLGGGSAGDPLANSVFGQAAAQPNMAAHADPLKSLNSITRASGTAAPDTGSELRTPFNLGPLAAMPPVGAPPAAMPLRPSVPAAAPPAALPLPAGVPAATAPQGAVLSWNEPSGDSQTVIRPRSARPGSAMAPAAGLPLPDPLSPSSAATVPDDLFADLLGIAAPPPPAAAGAGAMPAPVQPSPMQPGSMQAAPVQPAPMQAAPVQAAPMQAATSRPAARAAVGPADTAELIAALREGLAVHSLPIDSLTPEFMRLLGQLVHEATRGTVDLLVARAALKREVRAELTMIVAKENNPLKFSPTVDVALGHLLSPPARGFMPPDRAMRDAYADLRAHQFGFLAGMKAALEGVLGRFDPAVLEGKLTQKKSMLATLVPATRKARMWEAFIELYGQISAEASDDFHELFGKEFLRAYEAYIDRLERDR